MGRGPAVSQEPFTACASSPYPLRTPPGSSASIASKPAILAKIMHRRPAADLSGRAADPGVMHAVHAHCPRGARPNAKLPRGCPHIGIHNTVASRGACSKC